MNSYYTYFDERFLSQGLALIESLRSVGDKNLIFVLCLDSTTYNVLNDVKEQSYLYLHELNVLEEWDWDLKLAKETRSLIEYYFTLTSCYGKFLFDNLLIQDDSLLTYIDADIYFFSSMDAFFSEVGLASIAVTPHNFSGHLHHLRKYGLYNVGILSFRKDNIGEQCISDYRRRCLEWCFDRVEGEKFGDQKYLDSWALDYSNLIAVTKSRVNISYWNIQNYDSKIINSLVYLDGKPLVCWHFSGLRQIGASEFRQKHYPSEIMDRADILEYVYEPYKRKLLALQALLKSEFGITHDYSRFLRSN